MVGLTCTLTTAMIDPLNTGIETSDIILIADRK